MLRSEFLWWFLHEEREIPYQNQLQTWVYSRRVTRAAVIFWATAPVKIVFSFLKRRIILNFDLQNHLPPVSLPSAKSSSTCLFALKDWDSCNAIGASSANCSEKFHSGELVLKIILKEYRRSWFDFQVGCQPQIIYFHCLAFFFCQKQGDCDFQFKSHRMRKIFRSVLTFCYEIIRSGKHHPLKNSKCLRSLEYDFQTQFDKIIVKWKAIHHHRANQNPHQRWSYSERKSALHHPPDRGCDPLFSRASGTAALDTIRTHSAEMGFWLEFEGDLTRVCQFL